MILTGKPLNRGDGDGMRRMEIDMDEIVNEVIPTFFHFSHH